MSGVRKPSYGRCLEDFKAGDVYAHPWDVTVDEGMLAVFYASFQDATPTYASRTYARALGLSDRPVHPLLLLNLGLSFSVHDVSEQAIAHLAYIDVRFPTPCYPGDTVTASSQVLSAKGTSRADRGVVEVRTVLANQLGHVVCRFDRKALVRSGGVVGRPLNPWPPARQPEAAEAVNFTPSGLRLGRAERAAGFPGLFEDFDVGDVIFLDEGAHPNGVVAGDTLYASSKILAKEDAGPHAGVITFRVVGTKNKTGEELFLSAGGLFAPELSKQEGRIPEKVVEITRRVLVRKHP